MIQWILTIWSLVPLPFLNPAWTSGRSQFTYCWSLAWRILSITSMWDQRRQWHPTPVLLPGKSHGWRSLEGCSPWGRWGLDTTEWLHFHFSLSCIGEGNGNPLQCYCLENSRDGEAWWATVYGVTQSRTWLKWLNSSSSSSSSSVWDECNCAVIWTFFGIAFLWDWNENWPFPVLWPLLSFPNLLAYWVHIECSTFTASSFRIWNSSTGIPSTPLALFAVDAA